MKKVVVLTGAGISAESGISTYRDSGGLWEKYKFEEVATPEAFEANPELVLDFYNHRRAELKKVEPNRAHFALVELEKYFDVHIITQNVDNLHERAGSKSILHLHGELTKARSTVNEQDVFEVEGDIHLGDVCPKGEQLRPHIVWFGESVPMMDRAMEITSDADILLVIGTQLVVYPAASLVHYIRPDVPVYLVDPKPVTVSGIPNVELIVENATVGVPKVVERLVGE